VALSDAGMVVRGGSTRDPGVLRGKILEAIADGDGPVLSVWCDDAREGESREALLLRLCSQENGDLPYPRVQVGTAAAVRQAVDELVQYSDEGEPITHYHAVFAPEVASSQVEAFIQALGEPEPNPTGGKKS
jgi:hypothetical protein